MDEYSLGGVVANPLRCLSTTTLSPTVPRLSGRVYRMNTGDQNEYELEPICEDETYVTMTRMGWIPEPPDYLGSCTTLNTDVTVKTGY